MRHFHAPVYFVVALLAIACASAPTVDREADALQASLWSAHEANLRTAVLVRAETLKAAGEANARGLITDAQLERVIAAGDIAGSALRVAQAGLAAFVLGEPGSRSPDVLLATAQAALSELIKAAAVGGSHE